jgi:cytochrome P450
LNPSRWFAHDPNNYVDPYTFNPERFLGDAPELDPRDYVFSIGRRSCPGQLLAENTMFTVAVNILALVDVLRAKGPDGGNLPVDIEYSGEIVT